MFTSSGSRRSRRARLDAELPAARPAEIGLRVLGRETCVQSAISSFLHCRYSLMARATRGWQNEKQSAIVCLGEALVDFVCERPVSSLGEADFFVPRQGGSLANIAMAAARFSDRVELIGGVGDDEWGRWLRARLEAAGVDLARFDLLPGVQTSHAFVSVDEGGEPTFAFYGDKVRPSAHAGVHLDAAISGDDGVLVVGSDSLLGEDEREVTMRAVTLARERGWAILCDPNLRPNRWASRDEMVETISSLIAGADVVKLNEHEAFELSGHDLGGGGCERRC